MDPTDKVSLPESLKYLRDSGPFRKDLEQAEKAYKDLLDAIDSSEDDGVSEEAIKVLGDLDDVLLHCFVAVHFVRRDFEAWNLL